VIAITLARVMKRRANPPVVGDHQAFWIIDPTPVDFAA
jgi:hypothetical protein